MKNRVILSLYFITFFTIIQATSLPEKRFEGFEITNKGAWCWFADPRAVHYENNELGIKTTYVGYIDIHGAIKATQYDHNTGELNEVLIRSYFQPDDHNNPTFLALPNGRIMIFYSRHTDESCFYYRISKKPGDITTLGDEIRLQTPNNTTYPSPFILSDDPDHIYLCWRGIKWHPTIARLTMPDINDKVEFDWGPKQIIQSTAARPYAKYNSNGKNKIFLTYTTGHPDNEAVNFVYFNYIDIKDLTLRDIKGKQLSNIEKNAHNISATDDYYQENKEAVVDHSPYRNWVWQVSMDKQMNPLVAMVRISADKEKHDYYYVQWTGEKWKKTYLANAGGYFHQTPNLENCYSGGMAIDEANPNIIYCSVPIEGTFGKVYELVKYTINKRGKIKAEAITYNSKKNNIRPYIIPNSPMSALRLIWMHGDYYDWIVSRDQVGYPTAIHTNKKKLQDDINLKKGLIKHIDFSLANEVKGNAILKNNVLQLSKKTMAKMKVEPLSTFTLSLEVTLDDIDQGIIFTLDKLTYGLTGGVLLKPYIILENTVYNSSNVLGTSDVWLKQPRATDGKWPLPALLSKFHLVVTYDKGELRTYINGIVDQYVPVNNLLLKDIIVGGFEGNITHLVVFNRVLSQSEIKRLIK